MSLRFISPFLIVAGSLALTACSTEESDPPTTENNKAPAIFIQSQVTTEEGKVAEISFNVTDDRTPYADLNIQVIASGLQGRVTLDPLMKQLRYSAPYLTGKSKQLTETFTLKVTDKDGLSTEQRVVISVTDINSPVSVSANVPIGAFGYENTVSNKSVNAFAFADSDKSSVSFSLNEDPNDADIADVDFTVSGLFKNQVKSLSSANGDLITLEFDTPTMTSPSLQLAFTLSAQDNDGKDAAAVNLTLLKRHTLAFDYSKSSSFISEKNGGELYFIFSEATTYPGEFSVSLSDESGSPLNFTLPYTLDKISRKITFSPSSGFLGDRRVVVNVSHSATVQNAAGERYDNVTSLQTVILVKDDRDDDFASLIESFKEHSSQASDVIKAREEHLVALSLSNQLLLNNAVRKINVNKLLDEVSKSLDEQEQLVETKERQINILIGANKIDEANVEILSYINMVEDLGKSAREYINEWYSEHVELASISGLKKPSVTWSSRGLNKSIDEWSHYIGNLDYGFYDITKSGVWQFKNEYSYLSVLKENRAYCI